MKDIFVGIVTWLICCLLQFSWNHLKASLNEQNNEKSKIIKIRPAYNKKFLVKEYYISLSVIIICFIISIKAKTMNGILSVVFISIFTTAIFFNWCAFGCMNDIAHNPIENLANNDSQNTNE